MHVDQWVITLWMIAHTGIHVRSSDLCYIVARTPAKIQTVTTLRIPRNSPNMLFVLAVREAASASS